MKNNLDSLPGRKGLPIVGEFLNISKQGIQFFEHQKEKYGEVYKFRMPTGMVVGFMGETSAFDILKNRRDIVNIGNATKDLIESIYPNSIVLMDGEKHKRDRSILMQAFRRDALNDYIKKLPQIIYPIIDEIRGQKIPKVHPIFKNLLISITGRLFYGIEDAAFLEKINKAITPMSKSLVNVQLNFPGTVYHKALKGRKYLLRTFLELVAQKRANPGQDFFSNLCIAANEDGESFTDQEIVDHLLWFYQASYDTTSWALSYLVYRLAKSPEWQEKTRLEIQDIDLERLDLQTLLGLKTSTMVLYESMRLAPSVPLTIREANEDLKVSEEITIPKGTKIWVSMAMAMKDPNSWRNPEKFDPERFGGERKEHKKCPHAYLPFGAGPHQCIGRVFAEIVIKMTMIALLKEFRVTVPNGYEIPMSEFPLMRPKDGLPIHFEKLEV